MRDLQTERSLDGRLALPLSYRFYLADAVFMAVLEGEPELLSVLDDALRRPHFPLFLGRRSCPPVGPVPLGLRDGRLHDVLRDEPWLAAAWWRRRTDTETVALETVVDADPGVGPVTRLVRDAPVSFDPLRREYGWRTVAHGQVHVATGRPAQAAAQAFHEPMTALGGA